jgi:23S rRNA (adenine-N6)-dimethyltransferase
MQRDICHSQNFIYNPKTIEKLLTLPEVDISMSDVVIDIGAGKGAIAAKLLPRVNKGRLLLVELDPKLCKFLVNKFSEIENVEIFQQDFMDFRLPTEAFKIFANIPFNYTSDILNKILSYNSKLECAYLVMQKEALKGWGGGSWGNCLSGDCSSSGCSSSGCSPSGYSAPKSSGERNTGETLKSLLIYPFYEVSQIYKFSRDDFKPKPSVDCVFAKITRRDKPLIEVERRNSDTPDDIDIHKAKPSGSNSDSSLELYYDFMAAISTVRVGEGIWKKIFTKKQRSRIYNRFAITPHRGIRSQNAKSLVGAFQVFRKHAGSRQKKHIKGYKAKLERQTDKIKKMHRTRKGVG